MSPEFKRARARLMMIRGVNSIAEGNRGEDLVWVAYVEGAHVAALLPGQIDGRRVVARTIEASNDQRQVSE